MYREDLQKIVIHIVIHILSDYIMRQKIMLYYWDHYSAPYPIFLRVPCPPHLEKCPKGYQPLSWMGYPVEMKIFKYFFFYFYYCQVSDVWANLGIIKENLSTIEPNCNTINYWSFSHCCVLHIPICLPYRLLVPRSLNCFCSPPLLLLSYIILKYTFRLVIVQKYLLLKTLNCIVKRS